MQESTSRRGRVSSLLEDHFLACEQVANTMIGRISDKEEEVYSPAAVKDMVALSRVLAQLAVVIGRLETQQRGAPENRQNRNSIPQ